MTGSDRERYRHAATTLHDAAKPMRVLSTLTWVTPLTSAMTLTTHGTEYYRDPEMVRLAMQGVKVHEVDGVKFDLYSAGAVLFSMVEDSFPAHGSLSQVTKRCPEALQWIIRRSMADIQNRYTAAWEMLEDLGVVAAARDPYAVLPADLPSFHRRPGEKPLRPEGPAEQLERVALTTAAADAGGADSGRPYLLAEQRGTRSRRELRRTARTSPPVRRRRRRRVLQAAVLAAIFFTALARWSDSGAERRVSVAHETLASSLGSSAHLFDSERAAVRDAAAILESVSYDDHIEALAERWRSHLQPVLPEPRPVYASSGDRASDGSRILVLEDTGSSIDAAAVSALAQALASNGFDVLGEYDDELDIDIVAGVRHAVGLGSPDDADSLGRLQRFLDDQAGLDAVLWVSSPDEEAEERPAHAAHSERLACVLVRRDAVLEPRGWFELEPPSASGDVQATPSTCAYDVD